MVDVAPTRVSRRRIMTTALPLGLLFVVCAAQPGCGDARPVSGGSGRLDTVSGDRGLITCADTASPGFVLFNPLLSTTTYLIDRKGRVVHTWECGRAPGASVYLLDSGNLLRCARARDRPIFLAGGEGGRIQEFDWEGKLLWDFTLASPQRVQHHDIEPLPSGNVLAIVWERKTRQEAIQAGRRPGLVPDQGLLPDCVLEVEPYPPQGGRIVWEWHVWDHLIQDHDPEMANYGAVSEHPELVDINGDHRNRRLSDEVVRRLKALGYIVGDPSPDDLRGDLLHTNAIAYNPDLDQIALSAHTFNEIWIIDHGTTTTEAAGHSGGRAGRGGDLLYRWGNPQAYGRGSPVDQQLFGHHDARWIPEGLPGEGNLMVFNNGTGRRGGDYSSVMEIAPPTIGGRGYLLSPGSAFGPAGPIWAYMAPDRGSFSADFISGAHRLPNGNTFICAGPTGRFFEVTPSGEIVWEYLNPFAGHAPNPAGDPPYSVFRATHVPPAHPALAGRSLEPIDPAALH